MQTITQTPSPTASGSTATATRVLRVGVAGLGRTGWHNHALKLAEMPDRFSVVAVSDPDTTRQAEARERLECRAYAGFEELVNDPDIEVLVVATPSHLHCEHAVAALEAGKHVICEKPMAVNLDQADKMIAAAESSGRWLTVFQNKRYQPDFLKVREVIQSGKLGRVYQIRCTWTNFKRRWDWQTLRKFGGGCLNNTGPHPLDQLLLLFGDAQPEVFCRMDRAFGLGDAEDHVRVLLHGEGAPLVDLEVSQAGAFSPKKWIVYGTHGGLEGSGKALRWKYVAAGDMPSREISEAPVSDRTYNKEKLPWVEEAWECDGEGDVAAAYYHGLHEQLSQGLAPEVTAVQARRLMAVIEECHRQTGI